VEGEIDYSKHTELELVDMFSRLDPRYAPEECVRLGRYLAERGYVVAGDETGPGSATPSSAKLEELIGAHKPFECQVDFSAARGLFAWSRNYFGFVGSGTLVTDGIYVWISGRVSGRGWRSLFTQENAQITRDQIANVEADGRLVRFECNVTDVRGDVVNLWLADATAAARLVAVLPKRRSKDFKPRL
jgi:hypothetical protein